MLRWQTLQGLVWFSANNTACSSSRFLKEPYPISSPWIPPLPIGALRLSPLPVWLSSSCVSDSKLGSTGSNCTVTPGRSLMPLSPYHFCHRRWTSSAKKRTCNDMREKLSTSSSRCRLASLSIRDISGFAGLFRVLPFRYVFVTVLRSVMRSSFGIRSEICVFCHAHLQKYWASEAENEGRSY